MADQKITELTENTDPQTTDIMLIVDDPGGTPLGQKITLANLKALISGYTEGARVYGTANQAIENETSTVLVFQAERYDTDTIHDNSTNNSRLTCKTAGKYLITGNIYWDASATGYRGMNILLNGSTVIAADRMGAGSDADLQHITTIYNLSVDDYVELQVNHSRGSSLDIVASGNFSPEFMMQRIG